MLQVTVSEESFRRMLKEAVVEALDERRDLLHDVMAEALEEAALAEAIREGQESERVSREDVLRALDGPE